MSFSFSEVILGVIKVQSIDTLWDVGANTGQFAEWIRGVGFAGRVVSFEPLVAAYAELRAKAGAVPGWTCQNIALGSEERADAVLNVAANSVSTSLREMLPAHAQASKSSVFTGTQTCTVKRLDDVWRDLAPFGSRGLLKLDTQGTEDEVIAGAAAMINESIRAILVELSFVELYTGQAVFPKMYARLVGMGFRPAAIQPVFYNRATFELLQADWLFVRV